LGDIERALLLLAWATGLVYVLANHLLDPQHFASAGLAFVSEEGIFKFDTSFIAFGFFYYAFIGVRKGSPQGYILSLPFLGYLVFEFQGRSLLLALLVSFVVLSYAWKLRTNPFRYPLWLACGALLAWAAVSQLTPRFYADLVERFGAAFTVVVDSEMTGDPSANARMIEAALVLPSVDEWWLAGTGVVSNQWDGSHEAVAGSYFYAADIGVLGVVYLYGVLGLVAFGVQFVLAAGWSRSRRGRGLPGTALIDACNGFLLFSAIRSLATGQFAFNPEVGFMLLAVLWCAQREGGVCPVSQGLATAQGLSRQAGEHG